MVENRDFLYSLAFDAPLGGPRRNITTLFGVRKREWCVYPTVICINHS